MKREAWGAAAGLLFGLGLAMSGLTSPDRVLDVFDIAGRWDPSILLTAAAALAVSIPAFVWLRRRGQRLGGGARAPVAVTGRHHRRRLLAGSAILGIGVGVAGYLPATGMANLAYATTEAVLFVIALLVGSQLARFTERR